MHLNGANASADKSPLDSMTTTQLDFDTLKLNVQRVCDFFSVDLKEMSGDGYAQPLHEGMTVDRVYRDEKEFINVEFNVKTEYWMRNGFDIMHGGCAATIVDLYSSLAMAGDPANYKNGLATDEELAHVFQTMGVSRNLQVQYLLPTPLDTDITVQCRLVLNTKRNALIEVYFWKDGKCLIEASHDKAKPGVAKM